MNGPRTAFLKRKEEELRWKLASLPEELKDWRERAQKANSLEKNHSQIDRLSRQIEGLQAMVMAELVKAVDDGELWLRAESLEKKALIVHTLWDQFRSRLSLRLVSPFDTYLALADAYARECYVPVYRHLHKIASDQLCPAPLVTFDHQVSPWMKPEAGAAELDGRDGTLLTAQQLQDALEQLPLALIGLPWSYITYLPHIALLAHEVGHAIERSAQLTKPLDQAVGDAKLGDEKRRAAWQDWRKEVFADWYGCAMGGPAFVRSLVDHLANDEAQIARQTRPHQNGSWTAYPTATVRVLLACHTMRDMGFKTEADEIVGAWSEAYPQNQLQAFSSDFDAIVNGFCSVLDLKQAEYGSFSRPIMDAAILVTNMYRQGGKLAKTAPKPARAYVTAARLLTQGPPTAVPVQALWQLLRQHHLESRPAGVAGEPAAGAPAAGAPAPVDLLAKTLFANVDADAGLQT